MRRRLLCGAFLKWLFVSGVLTAPALGVRSQDLPVAFQAESGIVGSNMRTVDTLGVTAVIVKTNIVNAAYPGTNRIVSYEVTFPDSGTYYLYARILVGLRTYDDDSYFYGNGFGIKSESVPADWITANGLAPAGYTSSGSIVDGGGSAASLVWKWVNMSLFNGGETPVSFRVEQGQLTQTFQIGAREDGLYIDRFVFGRKGTHFTVANLMNGEEGVRDLPAVTSLPLATGQSKFLGCEWDYVQAVDFEHYWNQITPGNAGKWGSVEYVRNQGNWAVLDSTYNVARRNHFPFKLHTLIWGAQQPAWMSGLDSATQRHEIEQWFSALAARYDSFAYIDVVNEPIHNAPNGMVPWGTTTPNINYAQALGGAGTTGWDWVITAFRLARQYFPKSKLLINEYSVINSTTTTQTYLEIINLLKAENLIDGIGEQAHAFTTYGIAESTLTANLNALAATGLPIYLTEMDIDGTNDLAQLREMQRVFPVFWEHPAVQGITFWGYRYGLWRNAEGAYLFRENGTERPAMTWLKAYVNDTLHMTQSITLTSNAVNDTIFIDETLQMRAVVLPANTTIPTVGWIVTPSGIATINQNGLFTPVTTGKVTVKASAWDGSNKMGTKIITIISRPADSIIITSTGDKDTITMAEKLQMQAVLLPANATNPLYTWSVIPAGLASISTNGLLSPLATGTVTVIASANDGSGVADSLNIQIVNVPTGIKDIPVTGTLSVYPNPVAGGEFTISGFEENAQISITDLMGQTVWECRTASDSSLKVVLNAAPGMYIIRLTSGEQQVVTKILLE